MNGLGITGGYTGTGYTGDVLIYGNLLVTGGIDPTYLALTPQTSGPIGFTNPLWVDSVNQNALRSEKILISNGPVGTGNLTINNSLGTGTLGSLLTLNQTNLSSVILYTEKYNQRTASFSTSSIQDSYFAKNGTGTKTEQARVRIDTPTSNSGQYTIAVNQSGVVTNYLTANGSAGSLDMSAPFLNMTTHPILGVTTITDFQALPFLPQGTIEASSNNPVQITAYGNNHQVLLKAKPVPTIDTLTQQVPYITNATIRCSTVSASYQWLGLDNGEVYVYDSGVNNWALYATFTGASGQSISALHYDSYLNRLYIGGLFDSQVFAQPDPPDPPVPPVSDLHNVCYVQAPTTTTPTVTKLSWVGATDPGFNSQCYAITGNNSGYIYFAGDFTYTFNNSIQLRYIGFYDQVHNIIYPPNGNDIDGFNGAVWNIDFLSGASYICVTGGFTTLTSGSGSNYSPYCLSFSVSGNSIGSVTLFDGGNGVLTNPIDNCWDCIDNNGSNFFVALGNNTYGSGVNYLAECPYATMTPAVVGAGAFNAKVTSLYYNFSSGYTEVVTASNSQYIQNGSLYATIPWTPWVFRFKETGVTWFNRQGVGTQWAFLGSTANTFVLQSGRTIKSGGVTYTGGISNTTPVDGYTLLLNWNGVEYFIVSQIGTGWNPYT